MLPSARCSVKVRAIGPANGDATVAPSFGIDDLSSEWALAAAGQARNSRTVAARPQSRRRRGAVRDIGRESTEKAPHARSVDRRRRRYDRRQPDHPRPSRRSNPRSRVPTSVPEVVFSDQRLANGLRVIVAEDHLAPVVAVNLWYDVGSKHEVPGKTGFAHLFEHVMFQGSRHVGKAEHIALVQAAGGTMNGIDLARPDELLRDHAVAPARARRCGSRPTGWRTLLDALSQENLDNQREVVKNEKRWSYDNRPYGSWQEKLQAHLFPPEHPYHHSTIGSMEDLDAASLEDVSAFFRTYYAPEQRGAVGRRRRRHGRGPRPRPSATSARIPANPAIPPLGDLSLPPTLGGELRETVYDRVPLPRVHLGFRAPVFGDRRLDALDIAGQILAGGKGSRLNRRLVREERIAQDVALFTLGFIGGASICAGWATVRPGRRRRPRRGRLPRGARAARPRSSSATTSWPGRRR